MAKNWWKVHFTCEICGLAEITSRGTLASANALLQTKFYAAYSSSSYGIRHPTGEPALTLSCPPIHNEAESRALNFWCYQAYRDFTVTWANN
jgi:hypothetical protein